MSSLYPTHPVLLQMNGYASEIGIAPKAPYIHVGISPEADLDAVTFSRKIISWNAMLCRGPQHNAQMNNPLSVWLAKVALGLQACEVCRSSPEIPKPRPYKLPLIRPPPMHSHKIDVVHEAPLDQQEQPSLLIVSYISCSKGGLCHVCSKPYC